MNRWIVLLALFSIFSNCPILLSQNNDLLDPAQEEELLELEFEIEEFVDHEVNDEFDNLDEQETYIEENGPIPLNAYVDIAEGGIEGYDDRFARFDSYFEDFHVGEEEIHHDETSAEHLHGEENNIL